MKLADLGWAPPLEVALEAVRHDHPDAQPARVCATGRVSHSVLARDGSHEALVAGRLRHRARDALDLPTVGDWVALSTPHDDVAVIVALLPRRSALTRMHAGRATVPQLLAANVDTVFVVCGLDADFNPRRIERYLSLAWSNGVQPVVLLSKADLCDDVEGHLDRVAAVAAGAPLHALSALDGHGLEALAPHLAPGRTVALIGSSGAGKSTLVNALLSDERMRTSHVRARDGRGRHTTSHRELFALPGGALLIDTPGLREVGLWDGGEGLDTTFGPERELATRCRFRDCGHSREPGCALRQAIERGELTEERLDSYFKLLREEAHAERLADARLQREHAHAQRRVGRARRRAWRRNPKR